MAWFTPAELPNNKYYIFGKGGGVQLAESANVPLLGQIPLVQSIRESADAGAPIVLHQDDIASIAFGELADNVARQVAIRNAELAQTNVVKIVV